MTKQDTPDAPDVSSLEQKLDYAFRDRRLLERALTHRSWAHESVRAGEEEKARSLHNEALEFVGDSVLGLIVADALFRSHPEVTEGELSRMKHRLVSTQTLARAARGLQLGEYLRVGRGEEKTGGRRKQALLADGYEALIAAIYLDGGIEQARAFLAREFAPLLAEVRARGLADEDYKSALQEYLQSHDEPLPEYRLAGTVGPDHSKEFLVEVVVRGEPIASASGPSKKDAEQEAARLALEKLRITN